MSSISGAIFVISTAAIDLDVYRRLCMYFNSALDVEVFPDPCSTLKVDTAFLEEAESSNDEVYLECRIRIAEVLCRLWKLTRIPDSKYSQDLFAIPYPYIPKECSNTQYIMPNLIKEVLEPGEKSLFQNRRLVSLPNGRVALVPESTKAGDIIACLAGSKVPYVLRPFDEGHAISTASIHSSFAKPNDHSVLSLEGCKGCQQSIVSLLTVFSTQCSYFFREFATESTHVGLVQNTGWMNAITVRKEPASFLIREGSLQGLMFLLDNVRSIQDLEIEHYKLIGECFVETLMMGWTVPELERGKKVIFAIH